MPEIVQDLNQPQSNPLKTSDLDSTDITPQTPQKSLLKNPKILLLAVLGGIIIILLILSLFVSAAKSIKKPPQAIKTSPTPTSTIPTPNPEVIIIPTQYQAQIKDLDNAINESVNFPIPQSDPNIGVIPNQ